MDLPMTDRQEERRPADTWCYEHWCEGMECASIHIEEAYQADEAWAQTAQTGKIEKEQK